MSEMSMIERLARAAYPVHWASYDAASKKGPEAAWSSVKSELLKEAREILCALREPTSEMTEVEVHGNKLPKTFRFVWQTMVDAALQEPASSR